MNSLRKQSTSNCYITRKNCKIANLLGFKWAQKSTARAIILGSSRKVISIMYLKYPRLMLIILCLCEECKAWSMINQTILSSVCCLLARLLRRSVLRSRERGTIISLCINIVMRNYKSLLQFWSRFTPLTLKDAPK